MNYSTTLFIAFWLIYCPKPNQNMAVISLGYIKILGEKNE